MANVHRFEKPSDPEVYRVDDSGSNDIEFGDLVRFTPASFFLQQAATGQGPTFVGVAEGVGPTPTSNIDNVAGLVKAIRVRHTGIFRMKKTTGDSLSHGDALVIGADAQTVLKQTGEADTERIAYAWLPERDAVLTGAGEVDVLLQANFPAVGIL